MPQQSSGSLWLAVRLWCLIVGSHLLKSALIVRQMNHCADQEFPLEALLRSQALRDTVDALPQPFGVIMLNRHAIDMTLNWLCNTAAMTGVHQRILFFTVDEVSAQALLRQYPQLHVFVWNTRCLQRPFEPLDSTYMSFFLLRTNLIRTLAIMKKTFWMLQADTFWRTNLFEKADYQSNLQVNVALDQQGHAEISQTRKRQMNGANFLVVGEHASTLELFDELHWYQSHFYVTDPDAVKVMCAKNEFRCNFVDHSIISGWEWIYGRQNRPPHLIQMDGETSGGKVQMLQHYRLWFLDEKSMCLPAAVQEARRIVTDGRVPRYYSNSKLKQKLLLSIGEFCSNIPLLGRIYRVYGGIPSLYLQFF